jgi:uncharacterized protein YbgA (DUF1722 family)
VNNEIITSKDLDDYCNVLTYRLNDETGNFSSDKAQFRKEALDKLIADKLILDRAKKEKLEVPSSWIEDKLKEIISSHSSREEFENSLIERGLTTSLLKERIKEQYIVHQVIEKYVRSGVRVFPQEISQYYNDHPGDFISTPKYILWIVKSEDKNFLGKIAKTIKEKGIVDTEKEYGNILMRIESSLDELKEEFSAIVKGMKENDSSIKKIDDLDYLVYLDKITPSRTLSLEEAKEIIYSLIWRRKIQEKFLAWIQELKEQATIVIYPQ